jgi:competence protein ComEA
VFDAPPTSEAVATPAGSAAPPARGEKPANPRLVFAGLIGALAIGGLAVIVAISGGGGATIDGPETVADAASTKVPVGPSGQLVVDVTGAVVTPGVYHLASGARVGDAIAAAGGFSPRVDAGRVGTELNLAAALTDGAQVRVPSRDDPAPVGASGGAPGGAGGGSAGALVNLNMATEAELDALSGIGPVTAGKIIESRATAPFKTVDELRERGLVGQKTFDAIKAQLTVS